MLGAEDDQDFNDRYEVHTIQEVMKEIRDEQARTFLDTLPYELKFHSSGIEDEQMSFVKGFAKETGDLKTLSYTDMKVIALGVQMAKLQGEFDRVKQAPKPLAEFRPKRF